MFVEFIKKEMPLLLSVCPGLFYNIKETTALWITDIKSAFLASTQVRNEEKGIGLQHTGVKATKEPWAESTAMLCFWAPSMFTF